MAMTETIDHGTLSRLVEAGAVRGAHIVGQSGGWAVMVKYGMAERPLAAQRSRQVRLFRRFETLVSYLKEIGIACFDVDAVDYSPQTIATVRRPDRAQALKRAHEAAAYDSWLREQVQASLDDTRPSQRPPEHPETTDKHKRPSGMAMGVQCVWGGTTDIGQQDRPLCAST